MRQSNPREQSKADIVRQRRQEHTQQSKRRVSKRNTYQAVVPVVITRGGVGTPLAKRAATNRPRRKLVIPLGSAGAEMHMPATPSIRLGWRLVSGLIVLITSAAIFAILNIPFLQINTPKITGIQRVPAADIEAVLGAQGMPIVQFNPNTARTALETSFPEFKEVNIQLGIPAQLSINVSERQPIIAWQDGNQTRWVDEEGVLFPPRGDGGSLLVVQSSTPPPLEMSMDLPTETKTVSPAAEKTPAPPTYERLNRSLLNAILQMNSLMPQGAILVYSTEQGLGWLAPEGWQVYMGDWMENLDIKMKVYNAMVDYLNQQGISPVMISIAQANAPFYRTEQ
ncbi:MAG: FtsQ-type POTRA domain-containing protein [Anaerolineaceae bacterium]|nr:FtsQ-type POTRA domain-containing protein [Anaerolineaceae bacterium]